MLSVCTQTLLASCAINLDAQSRAHTFPPTHLWHVYTISKHPLSLVCFGTLIFFIQNFCRPTVVTFCCMYVVDRRKEPLFRFYSFYFCSFTCFPRPRGKPGREGKDLTGTAEAVSGTQSLQLFFFCTVHFHYLAIIANKWAANYYLEIVYERSVEGKLSVDKCPFWVKSYIMTISLRAFLKLP